MDSGRFDADDAVGLTRSVTPEHVGLQSRQAAFHSDVGLALARMPRREADAVKEFRRAEALAPQRVRVKPQVRDAVAVMLNRARITTGGRGLRGLASRQGLEL